MAISAVVAGLAAAGAGGLSAHIDPVQITVWLSLVVGVLLGLRFAWYLLTGVTALVVLFAAISFANQDQAARLLILILTLLQLSLLFAPRLRPA
ncbi:MAG: hypothetical protein ACOYD4_04805 [Solirubrobacterales bacterium]